MFGSKGRKSIKKTKKKYLRKSKFQMVCEEKEINKQEEKGEFAIIALFLEFV